LLPFSSIINLRPLVIFIAFSAYSTLNLTGFSLHSVVVKEFSDDFKIIEELVQTFSTIFDSICLLTIRLMRLR